jgi:hypothetical protein
MGRFAWCVANFAALALFVVIGAGCCNPGASFPARSLVVSIDPAFRNADGSLKSVQVDIIAVNANEGESWKTVSLKDYWTPGASLAKAPDKLVVKFDSIENVTSKTIPANDEHWTKWVSKQAMDLVIISDTPASRKVVPLDKCRWGNRVDEPIKINVTSAEVVVVTQPDPEKK